MVMKALREGFLILLRLQLPGVSRSIKFIRDGRWIYYFGELLLMEELFNL